MDEDALKALHVAAAAIRAMREVSKCTVDNDNDSGEIIFTIRGVDYRLKLEELDA